MSRHNEKALGEIETLVREYGRTNSDWYFRRTVILELLAKLRASITPATNVESGLGTHEFKAERKYPWFCAHCGYGRNETLMHPARETR